MTKDFEQGWMVGMAMASLVIYAVPALLNRFFKLHPPKPTVYIGRVDTDEGVDWTQWSSYMHSPPDPDALLLWRRRGTGQQWTAKARDQNPYFNVANVYWKNMDSDEIKKQ